MALKLSNNATSTLAASITAGSTTLSIQSGDAGKFPTLNAGDWHPLTVLDELGNMEIMRCTARAGSLLTVERGKEGTTATAFTAGSRVDLRLTAAAIEDKVSEDQVEKQLSTLTTKTAPADADGFVLTDSAASNKPKRVLWSAIKSTIKDYLQPLFDLRFTQRANNLSDLANKTTALANLGALAKTGGTITGGLTVNEALNVGGTLHWQDTKEITSGADLNDYTEPGQYHESQNADATAGTNYPTGAAGLLYVGRSTAGTMVYQIYQTYQGDNTLYFRSKYNSSWSPWREIFHDGNFTPASKLNANAKAVDSAKLNGATDSASETANSIAKRTSSGDLVARLFQSTYGVSGSLPGNREFIMRGSTSDPFLRPITTASAAAAIAPYINTTPPMYTGTTRDNLNFPVGTMIMARSTFGNSTKVNRNSASALGIITGNAATDGSFVYGSGSGALAGTWHARGQNADQTATLFQRIA